MSYKTKASALLILLIIISLSLAGVSFYFFQQERIKSSGLQKKLEELSEKQKITEVSLENYKKKSLDLEAKLVSAEDNIEKLNKGLQQEKADKQEALVMIEQIKADLEQQKNLRADLENKFNQAQDEVKKIQAKVTEIGKEKLVLELKIKELESQSQSVELGEIVVNPEVAGPKAPGASSKPLSKKKEKVSPAPAKAKEQKENVMAASGLEGKVLVVNKEHNFVVINLGSKDGVSIGNVFSVYHNNKYSGDINVEKVHDSMAAAGFVSGEMKDKINEGDKVVQKVK